MASSLASSSKRLDICASEIANLFHLAGLSGKSPLKGKICLEIGSGWVLSDSIIFHLLGAEEVYPTDIIRNADPSTTRNAIWKSIPYVVRDVLGPFEEHTKIRIRFNALLNLKNYTFDSLEDLGIKYRAPVDFADRKLKEQADFIFSTAVLEHITLDDVVPVLNNLEKSLKPGGIMIHSIHLEDHNDFLLAPFEFLKESDAIFTRSVQSVRGNRIRASEWMRIFNSIPNMEFRLLFAYTRKDRPLPITIHSSISHDGKEDLRVSHLGVIGVKHSE
jgi:SAM-dependent methyltransferase